MEKFLEVKSYSMINENLQGKKIKIYGWVRKKRDHGGVLFLDLRWYDGIVQCICRKNSVVFNRLSSVAIESIISLEGEVVLRKKNLINKNLSTGNVEILVLDFKLISKASFVEFFPSDAERYPEIVRIRNRFLELREGKTRKNILIRSAVIRTIREIMYSKDIEEFHTPILTGPTPEGARDFLVPSRIFPGNFYALPQAPQVFKQILMSSCFPSYFQIAPCFRNEDSRADRSPGEFYQFDFETSFVSQEEIMIFIENMISEVIFKTTSQKIEAPFPILNYETSIAEYGTDKPDIRFGFRALSSLDIFRFNSFSLFSDPIKRNSHLVKSIYYPQGGEKSRSFNDALGKEITNEGGFFSYVVFRLNGEIKGPLAKWLTKEEIGKLKDRHKISSEGGSLFFICGEKNRMAFLISKLIDSLKKEEKKNITTKLSFCWIISAPMFKRGKAGLFEFNHNPFSMPQEDVKGKNPLSIKSFQYDLICNGTEIGSGAIRNHVLENLIEQFKIVGYSKDILEERFPGLFKSFRAGIPPHGGFALGIERFVMLLAMADNLREVTAFPLTQKGEDLLIKAPSTIDSTQLSELKLKVSK